MGDLPFQSTGVLSSARLSWRFTICLGLFLASSLFGISKGWTAEPAESPLGFQYDAARKRASFSHRGQNLGEYAVTAYGLEDLELFEGAQRYLNPAHLAENRLLTWDVCCGEGNLTLGLLKAGVPIHGLDAVVDTLDLNAKVPQLLKASQDVERARIAGVLEYLDVPKRVQIFQNVNFLDARQVNAVLNRTGNPDRIFVLRGVFMDTKPEILEQAMWNLKALKPGGRALIAPVFADFADTLHVKRVRDAALSLGFRVESIPYPKDSKMYAWVHQRSDQILRRFRAEGRPDAEAIAKNYRISMDPVALLLQKSTSIPKRAYLWWKGL